MSDPNFGKIGGQDLFSCLFEGLFLLFLVAACVSFL